MKKTIILSFSVFLILISIISLVGCTGKGKEIEMHKLGETVSTDIIDFTLDRAELAVALHDGTAGDWDYICLPKEFEQSDDNSCFVASLGHTLCSLQFTISNKNRVQMTIKEKSFISVEYAGTTYSECECKTGFYPSSDGHDWDGVNGSIQLDAGLTRNYRCGIDFPCEVSNVTDDFTLIINLPTSEDSIESFMYSVTAEDLAAQLNKELSLNDAIKFFGYDDGYQFFVNHMDEYDVDLSTEEIRKSLVGKTFNCYFIGESSHMENVGTFREDNQYAYKYKYETYTMPYIIEDNRITIGAKANPYSGTIRRITDTAYMMVNDGKPCGMIYE